MDKEQIFLTNLRPSGFESGVFDLSDPAAPCLFCSPPMDLSSCFTPDRIDDEEFNVDHSLTKRNVECFLEFSQKEELLRLPSRKNSEMSADGLTPFEDMEVF